MKTQTPILIAAACFAAGNLCLANHNDDLQTLSGNPFLPAAGEMPDAYHNRSKGSKGQSLHIDIKGKLGCQMGWRLRFWDAAHTGQDALLARKPRTASASQAYPGLLDAGSSGH